MAWQLSRPVLAMREESRAVSPFGRLCRAVLIGSILALPACAGAERKNKTEIDALLQQGRSVEAAEALRAANGNQAYLEWLAVKGREGYPLAQYELALRGLDLKDGNQVAAEWYARARLAFILDSAECRGSDSSMLFGLYLDSTYKRLDEFARTHQDLFASASQSALEADAKALTRPSAGWICDPDAKRADGGLLPPAEASNARAAARKRMEGRTALLVQQQALAKAPVNPDGFKVIQPPAQISNSRIDFWMDDARLVVRTRVGKDEQVWMWNVETGGIERLTRLEGARQLCYFDGFVRYERHNDGMLRVFEGPWGQDKEVWQTALRVDGPTHAPSYNAFSCQMYKKEDLPMGAFFPLLREHGFVGTDQTTYSADPGRNKLTLFDAAGVAKRQLSFAFLDIWWPPKYVSFLDAYVFVDRRWTPDRRLSVIGVSPDGEETETRFAPGPWASGSPRVFRTARGLLLTSNASLSKAAGVYFQDERGQVKKLLEASQESNALPSIGGCRIAATRGMAGGRSSELFLFDLCDIGKP